MTTKTINPAYEDRQPIVDALLGRRIVAISGIEPGRDQMGEGMLALDDGTFLTLEGHDGGCSCAAGCYWLKHLAGLGDVDNVITAVEFVDSPDHDDHDGGEGHYSIFVIAEDRRINLARFEGSDGNGYYGTGYTITIKRPVAR